MVKRTWYQDCYNEKKTWEVVKMNGAYYLRQYINVVVKLFCNTCG